MERMRETDALSWRIERDPVLRSNVVAVAWLDRSPDWGRLRDRVEKASSALPSFRQRVVELPGPLPAPRWVADDEFDLDWHLRRIDAPDPHGPEAVLDVARRAAMSSFDPARPLWEFTLVDRVVGGRAALVLKIHHSLTDGVGGIQLALHLFELDPGTGRQSARVVEPVVEPAARAGSPAPAGTTAHEEVSPLRETLSDGLRVGTAVARRAGSALPALVGAVRRPAGTLADLIATSVSVGRTVAPVTHTLSPIMTRRSSVRWVDLVEVGLDDLKRAARAGGGSLNDAFLTAATGAFRRYHERHGAPVHALRVTLPISIRQPGDPLGGNRITLMRFEVPVRDPDPARRLAAIHERCRRARHERSLAHTDAIAGVLRMLPSAALGSMVKRVDFVASDVPGFPEHVHLAGARVERFFAFSPTVGSAVNLTLLSYAGRCGIGLNADRAAVPDAEVFTRCVLEGFDEVLAMAGPHGAALRPLESEFA